MRTLFTLLLFLSLTLSLSAQARELLYVHTDRTLYKPGDRVWFRAYLTDARLRQDQVASDVVTVQLLDPGGSVVQTFNLYRGNNGHDGYLQLAPVMKGGRYTLRAFTNWLGNFGSEYFFTKHLYVQEFSNPNLLLNLDPERESFSPGTTVAYQLTARGRDGEPLTGITVSASLQIANQEPQESSFLTDAEGVADLRFVLPEDLATDDVILTATVRHEGEVESTFRPVRVSLQYVNLRLFPEGGSRSAGNHKIAFRATDRHGKPLDVSGRIMAGGRPVTSFSSVHNGYGHFWAPPPGKLPYYLELDGYPDTTFRMPSVNPKAVSASAEVAPEEVRLSVNRNHGAAFFNVSLLREDTVINRQRVINETTVIPINGLPAGVYLLRLTDETSRIRWERLFFHRPVSVHLNNLQVQTISGQSGHSFQLTDAQGAPVAGSFSVAIINDGPYTRQNDKQPHLVAQLLLQSQLTGTLYEPNDYFDPEQSEAQQALDDVLLCHGWRSYKQPDYASFTYASLKTGLHGFVRREYNYTKTTRKPLRVNGEKLRPDSNKVYLVPLASFEGLDIKPIALDAYYQYLYDQQPNYLANYVARVLPDNNIFVPGNSRQRQRRVQVLKANSFEVQQLNNVEELLGGTASGLEHTSATLDEVVIVGYGSVRKQNLTGAISTIYGDASIQEYSIRESEAPLEESTYRYVPMPTAIPLQPKIAYPAPLQFNFLRPYNSPPPDLLYWHPGLTSNKKGTFELVHRAPKLSATYRIILEGITAKGVPVHLEETFSETAALEFNVQFPEHAVKGDTLLLVATVKNNRTDTVELREYLTPDNQCSTRLNENTFKVSGNSVHTLRRRVIVTGDEGKAKLKWRIRRPDGRDFLEQSARVQLRPRLFSRNSGASSSGGQLLQVEFTPDGAVGDVTAELWLYGGPLDEIALEYAGMLREPHGCFEQVTSTSYPNALTVSLLRQYEGQTFANDLRKAKNLLASGYRQLSRYEQSGGGFGLWKNAPAKPRYSAMALLQFSDLARVWDGVDPQMMARTKTYLNEQIREQGFKSGPAQLYQLLALAGSGQSGLEKLIDQHRQAVKEQPDEHYYQLLLTQTLLASGDTLGARSQVQSLVEVVHNQSLNANSKSAGIGSAYGRFSQVEMLGYFIESYLVTHGYDGTAEQAFSWMTELKSKKRYQPTQAKIRYLRALRDLARYRPPPQDGTLDVFVNNTLAKSIDYQTGKRRDINLVLTPYLNAGRNQVRLRFGEQDHYPALRWQANWQTLLPPQSDESPPLTFNWQTDTISRVGDIVSYRLELQNTTGDKVNAPMLQIGLPGSADLLLKDLDPLVEQGIIDYYERDEHYLNLYFNEMAGGENRTIPLNLTARVAGGFQAPPTFCYPYYQPHLRFYRQGHHFTISR